MSIETAKHYNVELSEEFNNRYLGLKNVKIAQLFIDTHDVKTTVPEIIDFWYKNMDYEYKNNIEFMPGALFALQYLKSKGYTIVIASATKKHLLDRAVKYFNLDEYIYKTFSEEEVGKSKAYPNLFLKIFEDLNVKAEDCFYFEDSLYAIKTAKSLGMDVCVPLTTLNENLMEDFNSLNCFSSYEYNQELFNKLEL